MYTTAPFSVPAEAFANALMRRKGAAAVLLALPAAAAAIVGIQDLRWLILALMWLLIIVPAIMANVWLALTADRGAEWFVRPQIWAVDNFSQSVSVMFFDMDTDFDDSPAPAKTLTLTADDIADVHFGNKYLTLYLKHRPLGIRLLLIPKRLADGGRMFDFL